MDSEKPDSSALDTSITAVSASDNGVVEPEESGDGKALFALVSRRMGKLADRRMDGSGGNLLCIEVGRTEYMMDTRSS
jgi:hypothetical protein